MTSPSSTPPTLTEYTEERFVRELRAIKGFDEAAIRSSLPWARHNDRLLTTGYNSSITGGCVAYCATCDRMRVNDGPDSYDYRCRTCGTSTGRRPTEREIASLGFTPLVKVKPLVWEPSVKEGGYHAGQDQYVRLHGRTIFSIHRVSSDSGWMLLAWEQPNYSLHPTLEAAQAAAPRTI